MDEVGRAGEMFEAETLDWHGIPMRVDPDVPPDEIRIVAPRALGWPEGEIRPILGLLRGIQRDRAMGFRDRALEACEGMGV
jgi:hypothetical protein